MRVPEERQTRKKNFAEAYVFAALMFISFSMLLLSTRSFVVNFRDVGFSLFSGIRGSMYVVSSFASRTVLSIRELAELRREYTELVARVERFDRLERDAAEIKRENMRLREQLGFSQTILYRQVPAQIIGRDPDNLFSALVINKGVRDGIRKNMPIIAYQNGVQGLAGRVVQVGRLESLIMPVYDSSSFVSARLAESRYEGIVEGQGSSEDPLVMRYIKKRAKDEINFGDLVVSSGMGGIYPKDLIIGRVIRVLDQEYETSIEVELESVVDFSRLEYVFAVETKEGSD